MTVSIINDMLCTSLQDCTASHLWIQLDNVSSENKNNFLMGYLALLVQRGVFEEVNC
jgi:hypothetical protein